MHVAAILHGKRSQPPIPLCLSGHNNNNNKKNKANMCGLLLIIVLSMSQQNTPSNTSKCPINVNFTAFEHMYFFKLCYRSRLIK